MTAQASHHMKTDGRRPFTPARWRGWVPYVMGGLVVVIAAEQASGIERSVQTRIANYEQAPVSLVKASVQLNRTYSTPGQFPLAELQGGTEVRVNRSRVPYVNQMNREVPTYVLEGELELRNNTRKEVVVLQITAIFLNAFRERIQTDRQTLAKPLTPRQTTRIRWARNLPHEDVFELYLVITAARFEDGTVWAPTEELILLP